MKRIALALSLLVSPALAYAAPCVLDPTPRTEPVWFSFTVWADTLDRPETVNVLIGKSDDRISVANKAVAAINANTVLMNAGVGARARGQGFAVSGVGETAVYVHVVCDLPRK